jgi:pSer/pThr/pTyr-binding forkhead associated (FHA) protein
MNDVRDDFPRAATGGELKAVLEAERTGDPFLLYRDGERKLVLVPLRPARAPVTVGRRYTNDIVIDWDHEVSRVHAELECVGGEWTVSDDGLSRNGTLLDGDRITARRRLRSGDVIRVGTTLVAFRRPSEGMSTATVVQGAGPQVERLTATQHRILVSLSRPYGTRGDFASPATNQAIAAEVFLSVDAVKNHLRVLFRRFELAELPQNQKRTRLVETALRWGYVTERDL